MVGIRLAKLRMLDLCMEQATVRTALAVASKAVKVAVANTWQVVGQFSNLVSFWNEIAYIFLLMHFGDLYNQHENIKVVTVTSF